MQSTGKDHSKIIEIDGQPAINSVFFAEDGKQVVTGDTEGMLRRWRVDDGHEVGKAIQAGAKISAAALSPDRKWFVCGLHGSRSNVKVWDAKTHKKILDVKGHMDTVTSIDISSDSTKLATGSNDKRAFIWSMSTGKRLAELRYENAVVAVRFAPTGDRIATATAHKSIRIHNSVNGQQLLEIPCPFYPNLSSPLAWSVDGCQLYAASYMKVMHFDPSSGSSHGEWFVPGGSSPGCIALSGNQKFIAVVADRSLSFWDTTAHKQIGAVFDHSSRVCSMVLSSNDDTIVTCDQKGKITFRGLRDILPDSYFPVDSTPCVPLHLSKLPLISVSNAVLNLWVQGDLARVEQLLTEEISHPSDSLDRAHALAHRAVVRCRLKEYKKAIDDAKKSVEVQRSVIGYIALAISRVGNGEYDLAIPVFDVAFAHSGSTENNLLLLIKAIVSFEWGKYDIAISRVNHLIDIVHNKSPYIAVQAHMLLFLGGMSLRKGDHKRAAELLGRAREAIPFQKVPQLMVISLIFGWDFDGLALAIQEQVQKCIKPLEDMGDAAMQSKDPEEAIERYSRALTLYPSNPAGLLIKRSKVQAMLKSWEDALKDADDAIEADLQSPRAYERRHAALHGLKRFGEAVDAYTHMLSLMKDKDPCRKKYVSPTQSEMAIISVIREVSKICPLVLIDVNTGFLCNEQERTDIFKLEPQFMELVSSMTLELDNGYILQVVGKYFQYVTFSHVWEGKEPSFQDVKLVKSVWNLDSSPLNNKLRKFCEIVRQDGYRWAWSDTCCIDKMISTVLNQSLTMMYKWYEASAATLVFLAGVDSLLAIGSLKDSIWMKRAWTSQELLAPKVIRFYDRNWKPYLGDTRVNHKESPEIMQELANAIGIPRETIKAFNPDSLSVREKLRLASTRNATVEEDIAYSLIGIFKSDIRPHYGERAAALGHLLEEIITRSGQVTVLAWTGKSSSYNSCLPAALAVYNQTPHTSHTIKDVAMDQGIAAVKMSVSHADAMRIHDQITRLPAARFANRRLYLPCIIFAVKRLGLQSFGSGHENNYRARVPGIGHVEFHTSERLSVTEPRRLVLVHPWIRDLLDPLDGFSWGTKSDDDSSESDSEPEKAGPSSSRPLRAERTSTMDRDTRALRLLVRLRQPFHALLLQQQPDGEFKRVATEHEIVVPRLDPRISFAEDICIEVVEIL